MNKTIQKWSYDPHGSYFVHTPIDDYDENFDRQNHGFKLISSEGVSPNDFQDSQNSALLRHFEQLSENYGEICIYELVLSRGYLYLSYYDGSGQNEEGIRYISPNSGMKLEFEAAGNHKYPSKRCVVKHEEDPVFGDIIRVWEYGGLIENVITLLEDGRIIAITNDKATAEIWAREEIGDMKRELGIRN